MSSLFTEISKEVGWDKREVKYPGVSEVRVALERHNRQDIFSLVMWNRFLANPETPKQEKIIKMISDGLPNIRI